MDYNPKMATKIHEVTDGLMNSVSKLICRAAVRAIDLKKDRIDESDFEFAYEIHFSHLDTENPFSKSNLSY
jgi:hypothetical protein